MSGRGVKGEEEEKETKRMRRCENVCACACVAKGSQGQTSRMCKRDEKIDVFLLFCDIPN